MIQGFADAIIYGVNESSISVWRDKFRKKPPTAPASELRSELEVRVEHEIRIVEAPKGKGDDGVSL